MGPNPGGEGKVVRLNRACTATHEIRAGQPCPRRKAEYHAADEQDDAERVAVLKSYQLLDTDPEIAYDEISELAAQICQCPIAVIGLIDETRDWNKSKYGLPADFSTFTFRWMKSISGASSG